MDYSVYDIARYFDLDKHGNVDLDSNEPFIEELRALRSQHSLMENNSQLDLYAYKFYEEEKYWWALLIYNKLTDPDDTGTVEVRGPARGDLDRVMSKYYKDKL